MTSSFNDFLIDKHIKYTRAALKPRSIINSHLGDRTGKYYEILNVFNNRVLPPSPQKDINHRHQDYRYMHPENRIDHFNKMQNEIKRSGGSINDLAQHKAIFDLTGQCQCPRREEDDGSISVNCHC